MSQSAPEADARSSHPALRPASHCPLRPKPRPRPRRPCARHGEAGDGGVLHAGAGEVADQALRIADAARLPAGDHRSEEHTSELQSLMRISYAVFCLKKKKTHKYKKHHTAHHK